MELLKMLGEQVPEIQLVLIGLTFLLGIFLAASTVGLFLKLGEAMKIFALKPKLSFFLLIFYLSIVFVVGMFIWGLVKGWLPQ